MKKSLFVTAAFLTFVLFVSQTATFAQKKRKFPKLFIQQISYIQREAESEARYIWEQWITRCAGENYYTRDGDYIYQFKNVKITVGGNSLSPADRLNGVEYAGYTYLNAGLSRYYALNSSYYQNGYQNAGWSKWYDGLKTPKGSLSLTINLRKENGVWDATPYSTSRLNNFEPVDCSNIYDRNYSRNYRDNYPNYRQNYPNYRDNYPNNPNVYQNNPNNYPNNSNNYPNNSNVYPNNGNIRPNYDDNSRNNTTTYYPNNRTNNANNERVSWFRGSPNQSLPSGAIVGGVELNGNNYGRTQYLCRADYNGGIHPGRLTGGYCNIGYGGREIVLSNYEVAYGNGYWGKPQANYNGALAGGRETGRTLYVCRANYRESNGYGNINYGQFPGKVVEGKCNFGFGTREISTTDFEVFYPNYYSY